MSSRISSLPERVKNRAEIQAITWQNNRRLHQISRQVTANARLEPGSSPVVFFNATTRLSGVSQNAAFSFLAACGLQLAGIPVVHFACRAGLSRCVLATDRDDHTKTPPCRACISQSGWLYSNAPVSWFTSQPDPKLAAVLAGLDTGALSELDYEGIPLGSLVLPSLRWALRRHHLKDDAPTRFFFHEYIQSAYRVVTEFSTLLDQAEPRAVVVFNGMMYPEASARWAARQRGLRVVSHEVGLQPFTGYFTEGDATAYPIDIPAEFELSEAQNARLDAYLEQRFQGKFTMAGVQFWPEMKSLSQPLAEKIAACKQVVPVFTNVIFDTSQAHANAIFPHMFAWLDSVLEIIRQNSNTLFVIRAHPDEMRPGKESRESVQDWVERSGAASLPNAVFIPAHEFVSSYELIRRSKFVMVYNSSIGLEASLMGAAVLCAGKARFTQLPTVFFPPSADAFRQQAQDFLDAEQVRPRPEFIRNARRFLYYQLYRTSLPFGEYLDRHPWPGFVRLKQFPWQALTPQRSATIQVIVEGLLDQKPFLLPDA